jgi:hypothetical protein
MKDERVEYLTKCAACGTVGGTPIRFAIGRKTRLEVEVKDRKKLPIYKQITKVLTAKIQLNTGDADGWTYLDHELVKCPHCHIIRVGIPGGK